MIDCSQCSDFIIFSLLFRIFNFCDCLLCLLIWHKSISSKIPNGIFSFDGNCCRPTIFYRCSTFRWFLLSSANRLVAAIIVVVVFICIRTPNAIFTFFPSTFNRPIKRYIAINGNAKHSYKNNYDFIFNL